MACVEITTKNGDSEMEEGEIVDEVDELSDISSEEEFLLRQRLQVLENYNNVLERKQAKRSNEPSNGKKQRKEKKVLCDLSDVSETDLDDNNVHVPQILIRKAVPVKPRKRKILNKEYDIQVGKKKKDCKKKTKQNKKKITSKVNLISSDDSDDEYFNKRRKLANAVTLKKNNNDTSTLKDRINKMLFGAKKPSNIIELRKPKLQVPKQDNNISIEENVIVNNNHSCMNISLTQSEIQIKNSQHVENSNTSNMKSDCVNQDTIDMKHDKKKVTESSLVVLKSTVNICTDNENSLDVMDSAVSEKTDQQKLNGNKIDASSDEDLEQLRQYALKTKSLKSKIDIPSESTATSNKNKPPAITDDEDSDTAELRLICLKSTLLKKAIEMKQKQKLKKRLSQSSHLHDDITFQDEGINVQSENNTDIESVDMDMGSDGEEKVKENSNNTIKFECKINDNIMNPNQDDELEEDEDLLRAKLLTSLSKNLPNLVNLSMFSPENEEIKSFNNAKMASASVHVPEQKKIIIKLGESDSEGEHEATKNLTKMHMKLAEHYHDFQTKLDNLLKSTRKEFEKDSLANVAQTTALTKPVQKFVPKEMNHLPKSEQIEYKNLVKRMAELEKIKQARNSLSSSPIKTSVKETLKPRNVSLNTLKTSSNMDERIALSRKKIAEESAKILKLKEEAKKLSQKYKIVATELRNISTAINFNKKQQRAVHTNLQQIRLHHQLLLKGDTHNFTSNPSNKLPSFNKIQKENNPTPNDASNLLKSVKVSFVNDINNQNKSNNAVQSRLSVHLDVANNKKTIKLPKSPPKGRVVDLLPNTDTETLTENVVHNVEATHKAEKRVVEAVNMDRIAQEETERCANDYKSPLGALGNKVWEEDPNAFLCPYEVGGSCRDPECKYLHPKIPSRQ